MIYKYKYVTEDPKELGPILTPIEGGYKLTRICVDGNKKLHIEYENSEEEE